MIYPTIYYLVSNYLLMTHLCFLYAILVFFNSLIHQCLCRTTEKNSDWAFQWKKIFNPDTGKQAQEVIFGRKYTRLPLVLNSVISSQTNS